MSVPLLDQNALTSTASTYEYKPTNNSSLAWRKPSTFLLLYFLIWAITPALLASSVPLDVSEGINWGSEFQWGYYKHPPLSSWILFSFYDVFGHFGPYLLSQLYVILTLWLVYRLGTKVMSKDRALLGTALTLGVVYYTYPSLEFNHNVAQFPIWTALSLFFYQSVTHNRYRDWLLFALVGGLGMLTKYSVIFLLLPMALYLVLPKQWHLLKSPKPWLAALLMLAVFAPHFYWLSQNEWLPLTYANGRSHEGNLSSNIATHFSGFGFALAQLVAHLPLLVMLVLLRKSVSIKQALAVPLNTVSLSASAHNTTSTTTAPNTLNSQHTLTQQPLNQTPLKLLAYLWLTPLLLLLGLSLVFGLGLRDMWGMPMWSLSGLLFAAIIRPNALAAVLPKLRKYLVIWLGLVTVLMLTYLAFGHSIRDKPSRMDWPEQALAGQAQETWQSLSSCSLDSVSGDRWLGALVAMNSAPSKWPSQMISGTANLSPWMTPQRLSEQGTLVMHLPEDEMVLPLIDTANKANFAHHQGQWSLPWPRQLNAEPLLIEWEAYVPKSCIVN
ncbi:glycosyltransferase family 39 protein [Psychrobacter arenosus]|uniref:glycosyltransferase family 39 protein n=1 Tax=Psychrobacter arenosus TaxID=256326 RepID=UPI001919D194|nr:glycosyltransferase family 39 protein [Psychrobacter arenosus]